MHTATAIEMNDHIWEFILASLGGRDQQGKVINSLVPVGLHGRVLALNNRQHGRPARYKILGLN